jgi:sugar lactone lactonase YvrE
LLHIYLFSHPLSRHSCILVRAAPIVTLAGSGAQGYEDGTGTAAKFFFARGVAI